MVQMTDSVTFNETTIGNDCEESFRRLDEGLRDILVPRRCVPQCRFKLRNKASFNARIRRPGHQPGWAILEINQGMLQILAESIAAARDQIVSAIDPTKVIQQDIELTLNTVYDVAVHFVLLHELYHVYEGHLDYLAERHSRNVYSETERCFGGDDPGLDQQTAYYLEMEADSSALVSLLIHINFHGILEIVSKFDTPESDAVFVQELTGQTRIASYRIVLCAIWIVGVLMETNRPESVDNGFPLARMLSLVSTLMSWYVETNELQENEKGELLQNLSQHQVNKLNEYLEQVAKPVISQLWFFHHSSATGSAFSTPAELEQFLRDLQSLLLRQTSSSPSVQHILNCEILRANAESRLSTYRYIANH